MSFFVQMSISTLHKVRLSPPHSNETTADGITEVRPKVVENSPTSYQKDVFWGADAACLKGVATRNIVNLLGERGLPGSKVR